MAVMIGFEVASRPTKDTLGVLEEEGWRDRKRGRGHTVKTPASEYHLDMRHLALRTSRFSSPRMHGHRALALLEPAHADGDVRG